MISAINDYLWIFFTAFFVIYYIVTFQKNGITIFGFYSLLKFFVPVCLIYPFAFEYENFAATGENIYKILAAEDEAKFLTFLSAGLMLLGYGLSKLLPHDVSKNGMLMSMYDNIDRGWQTKKGIFLSASFLLSVALIFLVLGILLLGYTVGLLEGRHAIAENVALRPFLYILSVSVTILSINVFVSGYSNKSASLILLALLMCSVGLLTGSRGASIQPIMTAFVIYIIATKYRNFIVIGGVAFSLLVGALVIGMLRGGSEGNITEYILDNSVRTILYGNNFSDLRDFAWFISGLGDTYFYGKTYLADYLGFIPSSIMEFRSEYSLSAVTTRLAGISGPHGGLRSPQFGEVYINFGIPGLLIISPIFGLILERINHWVHWNIEHRKDMNPYVIAMVGIIATTILDRFTFSAGFYFVYFAIGLWVIGKFISPKSDKNAIKTDNFLIKPVKKISIVLLFLIMFSTSAYADVPVINLRDRGLPTRGDDTSAINKILAEAKQKGARVFAPCGIYKHRYTIFIDGVGLYGEEKCTEFRSTNYSVEKTKSPQNALVLSGENSSLYGVKTTTLWPKIRRGNRESAAILIKNAKGWIVEDNTVDGAASVGIFAIDSTNGTIKNNRVSNSLADGISVINGSSNIIVSENEVKECGDDCISVVSYMKSKKIARDILIKNNTVEKGYARGFNVAGGKNISIIGNTGANIKMEAFSIINDKGFNTYGSYNVKVENNLISDTGSGVTIYGQPSDQTSDIKFSHNKISGISFQGANIGGNGGSPEDTKNIYIFENSFEGREGIAASFGVYMEGHDIFIEGNLIKGFKLNPIAMGIKGGGISKISRNRFEIVVTDDININSLIVSKKSPFSKLFISENQYSANGRKLRAPVDVNAGKGRLIEKNNTW